MEHKLQAPYLVFLGDAQDYKQAKVAYGVSEWRPDLCVGQLALPTCAVDLGLPNMDIEAAVAAGAKTFLIGISPYFTELPEDYRDLIVQAMAAGLDIGNPLHAKLDERLEDVALQCNVKIHNFRHRTATYPKGNGQPRTGLRLLTVGTDCAIGKKFTAVSLWKSLQASNVKSTFRSTGQTGYLISGSGINNDTIEADFLSGAAEWLSPANDVDHWDLIEGQGALSHPSFAAGALSLIHGSQPDVIVMCTEPGRATQRGVQREPLEIFHEVADVLHMGRRTNPNIRLGAISVMTKDMEPYKAAQYMEELRARFDVPVFDPKKGGADYDRFVAQLAHVAYSAAKHWEGM